MSEQDKRAEALWRETFLAWANVYPADSGDSRRKYRKAVAVEAAALAQARREGVEAMRDAVVREKDVTPQDEARTNVIAARLLSKGGTDG